MRRTRIATAAVAVVVSAALVTACSSGDSTSSGGSGDGSAIINAWSGEPQNPLVPTNTSENTGGRVVDSIFAGLVSYTPEGGVQNEVAESIDTTDGQNYTITLKDGWTFTDGTPVTSNSFVDAWNYGALSTNAQLQGSFFDPIQGYDEVAAENPTVQTMSGLKVVDDKTFTIELKQPEAAFPDRLGFAAYYPLPEVAYDDIAAFGENPIGNGPYKFASEGAWQHNVRIDLITNPDYDGNRKPANGGVSFILYSNLDTAYTDLLSNNVDVLDNVPSSAVTTFETDLPGRTVNQPSASIETFTIPSRLAHFGGEEGVLRRQAISKAINRDQITEQIFNNTRTPAKDYTSPAIEGWTDSLENESNVEYDPEAAKALWAQADAIAPWTGTFAIAYNSDGGHQEWVDAVTNSIRNTLGIEAQGAPYPTFAQLRTEATNRTIPTAFRSGWQGDYPQQYGFLAQNYQTGGSSNDGDYSNPEFDRLLRESAGETDKDKAQELVNQAQSILLNDLPAVPNWYRNAASGWSENVTNVKIGWDGIPIYNEIEKN
ncbi:ABC transporter substrate-binding protein [Rhodococcus sp. RS1C4]|uniref:peptide ABC transporter substrate-binding protein n=1 Tax=Nocardiaceae TaxID=85025 RepID=UPI000362F1B4|nr:MULTISPECIES: ABC transporter substrate-binding protein [Rhodococcus]OZC46806.1 ABC transporter substrate-binding protein [Rhodococcus sp. 06-621-2]OZC52955.1 ABC transporter substrate-binding protein [Rhodococcus sp. RS1C4]OZC77491.1 ABC transporter substrate-binding protein [Rhodococcus sp. 06-418-1B]OZC77697.1 ABC transporter substrate-binding protein [Rhodococcus sp. 06-418-1B]OZD14914.1 ABC transporter substrate-binding protein [Rhodococcus sp. 06-156-4C]